MPRVRPSVASFTLIEMLVAMLVLGMIMAIIFEITSATGKLWKRATGNIQSFQSARAGFESMSRRVGEATLNTYYDYYDASRNSAASPGYSGTPSTYGRQSELNFVSGPGLLTNAANPVQYTHAIFFQAPVGFSTNAAYSSLNSTLSALGYYVTYDSDTQAGTRPAYIPATVPNRYRFRLMEFCQPTEDLSIYSTTGTSWFTSNIFASASATGSTHMLAENIVALIVLPRESPQDDPTGTLLSPNYSYNSRTTWSSGTQPLQMNQLPPIVHLVMVAIDEPSAVKICTGATAPNLGYASLFQQASQLNADLTSFEAILDANSSQTLNTIKLNYRVFTTDVAIRGAKWSN